MTTITKYNRSIHPCVKGRLCRLLFSTSSTSTVVGRDVQDTIAAVDDVAFSGDKNIFALHQEYFFRFSRLVGKAKKFERDRRRWRDGGGG